MQLFFFRFTLVFLSVSIWDACFAKLSVGGAKICRLVASCIPARKLWTGFRLEWALLPFYTPWMQYAIEKKDGRWCSCVSRTHRLVVFIIVSTWLFSFFTSKFSITFIFITLSFNYILWFSLMTVLMSICVVCNRHRFVYCMYRRLGLACLFWRC